MRQLDKPEEQQSEFGKPVNRKMPEPPQTTRVKEGIQELGGKLMTDIAKNAAAPPDSSPSTT